MTDPSWSRLAGRVVLITGAGSGIGRETRADVSDRAALTAAVDDLVGALGSLHVAFANAATLTHRSTITDLDPDA